MRKHNLVAVIRYHENYKYYNHTLYEVLSFQICRPGSTLYTIIVYLFTFSFVDLLIIGYIV